MQLYQLRILIFQVNVITDKNIFSDFHSPQTVKKRTQSLGPWANTPRKMKHPVKCPAKEGFFH